MNNTRRVFINQMSMMAGLAVLNKPMSLMAAGNSAFAGNGLITISHTNDLHGNANALLQHKLTNGLLFDGGDFVNSSHSLSQQRNMISTMNGMGYIAAAIGDHELANGQAYLANLIRHMQFSLVNCNYQFDDELSKLVKPYILINSGKFRIGVTGVGHQLNNVVYHDAVASANKVAELLKTEEKCDLVICLSHLGYSQGNNQTDNRQLANQSECIDMIISGHGNKTPKGPMILRNKLQHEVILSQTPPERLMMGKTIFNFDQNRQKRGIETQHFDA